MTSKLIQKTLLIASLLGTTSVSLNATETTNSLFAVEGGTSSLNSQTSMPGYEVQQASMGHIGLKLGAEGENYRIFFSARNFFAEANNKLLTGGIEAQYKFNFSKPVDFFIGVNTGMAYIEIGDDGVNPGVNTNTSYYGGDMGFNYHASEAIDLELGAKYMFIDDTVTAGAVTYDFRDLTSFYGSVIFKWQMD